MRLTLAGWVPMGLGCLAALQALGASVPPWEASTIVGSAENSGWLDGTNQLAQLSAPAGLARSAAGELFFCDGNALRRVVSVGPDWVVTTVAGQVRIHGGADGTNSTAQFDSPQGLAIDAAGRLCVADTLNNAVRQVSLEGTNFVVRTVSGGGRLFAGANDGTNTSARFNRPYGIAAGTDGLYVADTFNHTIRRLVLVGTNWVATTLAGSAGNPGSADGTNAGALFNYPVALAITGSGSLVVSDYGNHTLRLMSPLGTNWVVTRVAGAPGQAGFADGTGDLARFTNPFGLALDTQQNLCVADLGNNVIRRVTPAGVGGTVGTLCGLAQTPGAADGVGTAARFSSPISLVADPGGLVFVADSQNYTIRKLRLAPLIGLQFEAGNAVLSWPSALVGYNPQTSPLLNSNSWSVLPAAGAVQVGEYFFLTNTRTAAPVFFRLAKPGP